MQYQQKLNIFHIVWTKFRDNIPELNLSQTRFSNPLQSPINVIEFRFKTMNSVRSDDLSWKYLSGSHP